MYLCMFIISIFISFLFYLLLFYSYLYFILLLEPHVSTDIVMPKVVICLI